MSLSVAPPALLPPVYEHLPLQAPSYAVLPRLGEQRLALGGRVPARAMQSGTFEKRTKRLVLALYGQRAGCDVPAFDRGGWASGCVGLAQCQDVQKVEVKIEGEMSAVAERRNDKYKVTFLAETAVLWQRSAQDAMCPSEIPFRMRIPKTFVDNAGETWPLPPSFEFKMKTMYGFNAASQCAISVAVTLAKGADKFWLRDNLTLSTPFVLQARSRPPYATIDMSARLLDTLKTCPEAWSQHNLTIQTTSHISAQLFIPHPTIYCMRDPIPFHLQLSGSASALAPFRSGTPAAERGAVHVTLQRQISLHGEEGAIVHAFTTGSSAVETESESETADVLAWAGELLVDAGAVQAAASFRVGPVAFADFVAVAVDPPRTKKTQKAAFVQSLRRVGIALTTDRWQDMGEAGPSYDVS